MPLSCFFLSVSVSGQWRSKQAEVYPPVVLWTQLPPLSAFSAYYLQRVPEPHRCADYIQVAHLLLARFSAGE